MAEWPGDKERLHTGLSYYDELFWFPCMEALGQVLFPCSDLAYHLALLDEEHVRNQLPTTDSVDGVNAGDLQPQGYSSLFGSWLVREPVGHGP